MMYDKLRRPVKIFFRAFAALVTAFALMLPGVGIKPAQAASYAKKYNLKLTDGQDATAEIQKALDAAAKAGKKNKPALVSIPAGTYYIGKTVEIGSNTYLKLDKDTIIRKNPNPKDPILYMLRTKQGSKGGYADSSNITIEGGTWDAEFILYNNNSGGSLFFITHTSNLKILNTTLCNNFGTHLIEMAGAKNVTVRGCELFGFKAASASTEKEAVQMDVCHSESILPAGAPYDDTPCADITVTECNIHDYPRAVGSHMMVEGIYHDGITITDNSIHDISGDAIYGYNYINTLISGNTITNVGCAVKIKTDSTVKKTKLSRLDGVDAMTVKNGRFNIRVENNEIAIREKETAAEAKKGGSIGIYIHGSKNYPMSYVSVASNTVKCNSAAVYFKYIDHASVTDTTVDRYESATPVKKTSFAEDALKLLSCTSATISGCRISTVTKGLFENGIALRDKSSAELKDNIINAVGKNGIALYNSSVTGSGNTVNDSAENGIRVDKSDLNLTETDIARPGKYGVKVDKGTAVFDTVRISDSASYGIYAVSSQLDLAAANVERSGSCAVKYDASKGKLKGINVVNSGGYGICLDGASKAEMENITVDEAATEAVRLVAGSEAVASKGLEITGAGRHGIKVEDSVFTVDKGKVTGASEHAATISGNSTLTVSDVEFSASKGNAVQINGGTVSFENCTFTDNESVVLQIKSDTTVKNCIFRDNLSNAVQVLGAKAVISGNEFRDNCSETDEGKVLGVFAESEVSITGNTFSDPASGWEIFIAAVSRTDPVIATAKTAKVSGTTDAAGNKF